ncbi:MAG: zinc-dependent metalloprotease [Gammaproteobacteria bacterium]|nr:zinc-dependent metalloprotease [Gammaproteobacteria bacterium]MDH3506617.1 zinc-dependent metalloprotease [Gammaproteobacteria bacterium]
MKFDTPVWMFLILMSLVIGTPGSAQENGEAEEEDSPRTIADIAGESDRIEGLFTLFRNRESGETHLLIKPDQLNREFIYFAVSINGVRQGGHFRGNFRENRIISLRRHYDRIEFHYENTAFYFDPAHPLSRASTANISPALLASVEIAAEDEETGDLLIGVDELFVNENLLQIKATPDPDQGPKDAFRLGNLSDDKTKITAIRSYPLNTDIQVEYVYDNPAPVVQGNEEITDSRYVSISVQHSLIAVPENDYEPRFTDHRMGYFSQQITDLTQDHPTPYRDLVERWHLVKQDPDAEISAPVEPIVWWIENTTPMEFRDAVREGVLAWNSAFEKIGFRNAIEVRVQPDDADWEAEDVRYNVLRWTSSPDPLFSGYGPSFTNPRTGQIIGADIMLEYATTLRRVQYQRILSSLGGQAAAVPAGLAHEVCSFAHDLQVSHAFGRFAVNALNLGSAVEKQVLREFLIDLVLHEVGHTLGFAHNFAGSQMLSHDELYDRSSVDRAGLYATVMDYTDIHVAPPGREQTNFFTVVPGPYDDWIVEYSYSQGIDDTDAEQQRLASIAARSTQPSLLFGADDHVMRGAGLGSDPRIHWYDMSSDPIGYAVERIELIESLLDEAVDKLSRDGESYHELRDGYIVMLAQLARSMGVLTHQIGGVYINRSVVGQAGARTPFEPVALADQQRAMTALSEHLFAPSALAAPEDLYNRLQEQRRLWNFRNSTEDPKIHEWVLDLQSSALDHFLHPRVMTRITDSRLYGNEYGLAEVMTDLTEAIFSADLRGDVNTFRQNLQTEYVQRLIGVVADENDYDHTSKSMALYQVREIERLLNRKRGGSLETRAHTQRILYLIERLLEGNA